MLGQLHEAASGRSLAGQDLVERGNQNKNNSLSIWSSIFKWNYDHHLMKNLLTLFNKTLKGLNKYHVFRK